MVRQVIARLRNNSPDHDPALAILLRTLFSLEAFWPAYLIFHANILIEEFLALRALPASTFENINWTQYVPHA